jgi:hypothetical protein
LSKSYDKLWVFGDSYSTPGVSVDPQDSFWGLTAIHCNIPTIMNCSRPVNSFDSVCHLLISEQNSYDWNKDLFLIGIPPLERITIFDDHKNTPYYGHNINTATWKSQGFQIQSHHGIISLQNYGTDKQLVIYSDRSWLETQILRNIFLLTTWLDSKNSNYMIINLSKPFNSNNIWGPSNFVLPYTINHPRCILFKDTYHSINLDINPPADFKEFGWNGHHGSSGNKYFFEQSLLPTMQRNDIC